MSGLRSSDVRVDAAVDHSRSGGHPFVGNLYFGEFLDIPVHTSIVEKAPRVLGVTPTKLEDALAAGYAWYQTQPRRRVDYSFEDRLLANRASRT